MAITLHPDEEAWLKARVASGDFASVGIAWAKPYLDEGLAALDRGDFVSLEEHKAHSATLLKFL